MQDKILAIIPARSGSKGLKDKNIKGLNGKPMIAYTIEAAIKSSIFEDIIVSTDSKNYAEIALKYGAYVPFLRSKELSSETASSKDVILDVINKMIAKGSKYDYFMLLQPTSPLRTSMNIKEAYKLLLEKKANAVVSVCEVEHSFFLSNTLDETLSLDDLTNNVKDIRRQDLPKYFKINGAIYLVKVDYFIEFRNFYQENSFAYVMGKDESIDVDNVIDFKLAEVLLKEL